MDVLEQLKELESQKSKLVNAAKSDALKRAKSAVAELNALGFSYRLVDDVAPKKTTAKPAKAAKASGGKRRTGIRETVYKAIAASSEGMKRGELVVALNMKEANAKQAVSNALANLKKEGRVSAVKGRYTATA